MRALKFGDPAMIVGSAALGGLGSKISGGDFWTGFGRGLAIGAFNHAMHSAFGGNSKGDPPSKDELKRGLALALEQGSITQQEYNTTLNYIEHGSMGVIGEVLWDNKVEIGLTLVGSAKLFVGALRSYLANSAKLSQRVLGQTDAYHRAATFLRSEIAINGKISFKSVQTLSIKYTTAAGQKFSLGYNWVRNKIIHLSAGH